MAATKGTVRVTGYRETMRALNATEKATAKTMKDAQLKAAEPVAESARQKVSEFQGASAGTIGPRVTTTGAFVTQKAKKVTGQRGDFGALQMRTALIPALEEHEDDIADEVEDAFFMLARRHGF
jgi:hypothetical protein